MCQVDVGSRVRCQQGGHVPIDVDYCALNFGCCWDEDDKFCYHPAGYSNSFYFLYKGMKKNSIAEHYIL